MFRVRYSRSRYSRSRALLVCGDGLALSQSARLTSKCTVQVYSTRSPWRIFCETARRQSVSQSVKRVAIEKERRDEEPKESKGGIRLGAPGEHVPAAMDLLEGEGCTGTAVSTTRHTGRAHSQTDRESHDQTDPQTHKLTTNSTHRRTVVHRWSRRTGPERWSRKCRGTVGVES